MKRVILLILFLCSACSGQFFDLVPNQKPMLGQPICYENTLTSGLVACYLMNEGAGNRVNDLSGNGLVGTLLGNAAFVAGTRGSCLAFDGTGDYVDIGAMSGTPFANGSITLSLWMNTRTVAAGIRYGFAIWGVDATAEILRVYNVTDAFVAINDSGLSLSMIGAGIAVADTWYHIVITINGTTLARGYVNGIATITDSALTAISDVVGGIHIGTREVNPSESWNGWIDDVRIWSRALSESEVAQLYSDSFKEFRPSFNLVNYGAFLGGGTTLPPLFHHYQLLNLN